MVGTRKRTFKMKALRSLESGIFELVFVNTVLYKSDILLIFEVDFTESVLDIILYTETTQGPAIVEAEEKFSK